MRRFRRLFLKYVVAFALVAGFNFSFILILLEWTEQYTTMTLSFVCVLFTSLGLGEIFPSRASSSTSSEFPSRVSSETPGTGPSLPNGNGLVSFMLQVFRRFDERLLFWYITTSRLLFVATVLLLNASRFGERDLFSKFTKCDKITPNPDIVGSGVRCSMYILLLFVFASLLVATFHRQQSGTKELGCFVLISKHLPITECILLELILCRSLCNELELGYGQARQYHSYRLSGCCTNDRHAMRCVVRHFVVERRTSISRVDTTSGSRCSARLLLGW